VSADEVAMRRKAMLDALMPDEELRSLWLRHSGFHNAVNTLARLLPVVVDGLADRAKLDAPVPWGGESLIQFVKQLIAPKPQEAVDSEHLRDWYAQQ